MTTTGPATLEVAVSTTDPTSCAEGNTEPEAMPGTAGNAPNTGEKGAASTPGDATDTGNGSPGEEPERNTGSPTSEASPAEGVNNDTKGADCAGSAAATGQRRCRRAYAN